MNKIKRGLGRGLSSLIGETKIEETTNKLSIGDLYPNKFQPRKIFDEDSLNDLEKSIKERGIIQPIIVRKSDENSKFEIIAGERPWLAATSSYSTPCARRIRIRSDREISGLKVPAAHSEAVQLHSGCCGFGWRASAPVEVLESPSPLGVGARSDLSDSLAAAALSGAVVEASASE